MSKSIFLKKSLSYIIFLVAFYSILPYAKIGSVITIFNITLLWWVIVLGILYCLWISKDLYANKEDKTSMLFVNVFLIYNLLQIVRGLFISDSYWDFKGLIENAMGLSLPIVAYAATNKFFVQYILRCYVNFTLPLFILFAFVIVSNAYGYYLVPMSFLIFFIPLLNVRWRIIVAICTSIIFITDEGARSNLIKFGVPIVLLLFYLLRNFISIKILEAGRLFLIIIPLVMLFLGISGIFNVFKMDDYIKSNPDANIQNDLTADTRTGLYIEVLQTATRYGTWILGRSPAKGNETELFAELTEITGKEERLGNEVAILNIFTWTGLVGVILYLIVFYKASYLAINFSNNIFSKMIGLYISFRWLYSWVEDINNFSLNTFFLWCMIGLCFSTSFRRMSNSEMKVWVREIFQFKKVELI